MKFSYFYGGMIKMEMSTRDACLFLKTESREFLKKKVVFKHNNIDYLLKTTETILQNKLCIFQNIPEYTIKNIGVKSEDCNLKSFVDTLQQYMGDRYYLCVKMRNTLNAYKIRTIEIDGDLIRLVS